MVLKRFKKLIFIGLATFLLTGCNIYRQMVIPTPYYPNNNSAVQQSSGETVQKTVTTQTSDSGVLEASSDENLPQVTTIKQDNIEVKNKTIVQRIPFPEDEYNSLPTSGNASVKGKIYLITAGGNKIYGKHTRLYLNPVTSYSTQWYQKSYLGGAKMSKVDSRLYKYLKFTTSDSNGNFEFLNIPNGSYYLIGVVKCAQECGYSKLTTIRIAKKISVFGNETQVINLSKVLK